MRWLLVSARSDPGQGGIGTYVRQFANAAASAGIDVELMSRAVAPAIPGMVMHRVQTRDQSADFDSRIEVLRELERIRPYRYGLWSLAVAERLLELGRRWDVIEFVDCQAEGFVSLCSGQVRAAMAGVRMIIGAHMPMFIEEMLNGYDTARFGRALYHQWEREALLAADGVACASAAMLKLLECSMPAAHIALPFDSSASGASQPSSHPTIVVVGSIQRSKGVITWAESLNTVLANRTDVHAELIGSDTPTSPTGGSMWAHVQSIVSPAYRDRFRWHGPLDYDATCNHIRQATMVVVPSIMESFSYVAAEALAAGVPVLVTDGVGLREHVEGLPSVAANDPVAIAAGQLRILNDPNAVRAAVQRSRERLQQVCSPASVLSRRAEWAMSLPLSARAPCPTGDAMDEMKRYLDETEELERSEADAHRHHAAAPTAG